MKLLRTFTYLFFIILMIPEVSFGQWNIISQLNGGPLHPGWPMPIEMDDYISGFCFPSKDTGYYYYNYNTNSHNVMSTGTLMMSTDGGHNWNTCYYYSQYVWADLSHASFCNAREGYLTITVPGAISIVERNNGNDCNWPYGNALWTGLEDLCAVSKNKAFYITVGGYVHRLDVIQDTILTILGAYNFTHAKLAFVDENLGYLTGDYSDVTNSNHRLFRTTDGGYHWDTLLHTPFGIYDISVPDGSTVYLACDSGVIFKNADTSLIWNKLQTCIYNSLIAVSFHDSLRGFAISSGKILKTTDGGLSWITELPTPSTELRDIEMVTDSTAFITAYKFYRNVLLTNTGEGNQGLDENGPASQPELYPNPASDQVLLYFPDRWQPDCSVVASIFDQTGKKVFEKKMQKSELPVKLDLVSVSAGLYILQLSSQRNITTLKFIKE